MKIKTLGKKALALTVCLAVLLSCLIISGISTSAATVWDGTTKTQPTDSNGDGVYEIGTAAEFAWLGSNGGDGKYIPSMYLKDPVPPAYRFRSQARSSAPKTSDL